MFLMMHAQAFQQTIKTDVDKITRYIFYPFNNADDH